MSLWISRSSAPVRRRLVRLVAVGAALSFVALSAPPAVADVATPSVSGTPAAAVVDQPARTIASGARPASTGQYEATCINLGRGFAWSPNNVPNCPGFLYIYISGNQVAKLNTGGASTHSWQCDVRIGASVVSVFVPGGTVVGWAVKGLLSALGLAFNGSCK